MPTNFVKEWGDVFNASAVGFSKDINGLMKTDRQASASLKRILQAAQSPLGIINALSALDKISLAAGTPKDLAALPANIKLFKSALANLGSAKSKYAVDVDEALNANVSMYPNGPALPRWQFMSISLRGVSQWRRAGHFCTGIFWGAASWDHADAFGSGEG